MLVQPGALLNNVVSIVPSVSIASHASILTGEHQSEHRIPGHRWLDSARTPHNYLGPGIRQVNADLAPSAKTVYEMADSDVHAIQSIIRRGAAEAHNLATLKPAPLIERAVSVLQRNPTSSVVLWLPRGDALAHRFGPNSPETRRDMIDTSRAFGHYFSLLGTRIADYRIIFVPDHGHRLVERGVDLRPRLRRLGMEEVIQNPGPGGASPNATILMSSGDSACYVYPPHLLPTQEVQSLARRLSFDPSIELVVYQTSQRSAIYFSEYGSSEVTLVNEHDLNYNLLSGDDPLSVLDSSEGSTVTIPHFRANRPDLSQRYPDILRQTFDSWVEGRSGSILLMASPGFHFGMSPRVAWRLGHHRGSHGGPLPEEVIVAAMVRGVQLQSNSDTPIHSSELIGLLDSTNTERALGGTTINPVIAS